MVKDLFREAASGGNPPAGWNIDRIYINNRSDYYLPVVLKDFNVTKSMFYRVLKDWLLYSCPIIKQQLTHIMELANHFFPFFIVSVLTESKCTRRGSINNLPPLSQCLL